VHLSQFIDVGEMHLKDELGKALMLGRLTAMRLARVAE